MSDSSQQTLSVPSLLLLAAFAAITVRYFFFAKPSSTSSSTTRPNNNPRAVDPAHVEQIAMMFPQIGRREIVWDLQRNGDSVNATTERILARGSLDPPPPSFQPIIPTGATPSTANNSTAPGQTKSEHIDLIKRYNLQSRLLSPSSSSSSTIITNPSSSSSSSSSSSTEGSGVPSGGISHSQSQQSWSNNKNERQTLLRRRREEMILNARRKLEEKERKLQQEG